jgi:hypothetical protein
MTVVQIPTTRSPAKPHKIWIADDMPGGKVCQVLLTVDQYHLMIESGILTEGEPIELLDGFLVRKDRSAAGKDPMTVGPDHSLTVKKLARLDRKLNRFGCHIQTQQPVTIPDHDEPEPDGAIVVGRPEDYAGRNPGPGDVTCVIEVSDSSLRVDRTTKLRVYADAGIPQYVIINLVDRVIEVYSRPMSGRYADTTTLFPGKRVELLTASKARLVVSVTSLLP